MEWIYTKGRIFAEDEKGKLLAEVTFPKISENTVDINHTFVDDSLRGQGIAGKLMERTVKVLEQLDQKAVCSCSYAQAWFLKHPQYERLLQKSDGSQEIV